MRLLSLLALLGLAWPLVGFSDAQKWEICLDKADFSFSADPYLGGPTSTVVKNGCRVEFAQSGGKGVKYVIDLCDPSIQLSAYASFDSTTPKRLFAGSTGCPKPLFGADFEENKQGFNEFRQARSRALEIWGAVKAVYGKEAEKVDLTKAGSFSPEVSAGKIACGEFLISEYLQKCMAFEKPSAAKH